MASLQANLRALEPGRNLGVAVLNRADPLFLEQVADSCELLGARRPARSVRETPYRTYKSSRVRRGLEARPGWASISRNISPTVLNVVDFGMNAQEAVDAGRMHHQWLPDRLSMERYGFSADTIARLKAMGHTVTEAGGQGVAEVIVMGADGVLEGGVDGRAPDGGAGGK